MPGLLADVNVQGHLGYLTQLIGDAGLLSILTDADIHFRTFRHLGLDPQLKDRELWNYCQLNELVLFTENRNHEDEDSLSATLLDSWCEGHLPVLTLANKGRFENSRGYAAKVAEDVASLLFSAFCMNVRDQPRIFVPLTS